MDGVSPHHLPQYGNFFQKKLEERLSQVCDGDTIFGIETIITISATSTMLLINQRRLSK